MIPFEPIATLTRGAPWAIRGLLAVAIVFLLGHARPLLLPVAIAATFTLVLASPVRWLRRRGVQEYVGAALVITALIAALVLLVWLVATPAAEWWSRAPATVQNLLDAAQRWREHVFGGDPRVKAASPVVPADSIAEQIASQGVTFTRLAIGETLSFTLSASATVILLYFLLASEHWLVARSIALLARRRSRALALAAVREAERDVGRFIGTMSLINIALGAATGLAVWAIGLPNPVLWGTITAVLAFIPYLGPALAAIALFLAGSVAFGTSTLHMFAPPLAFLALHAVEANLISPIVMGHRLSLSPVFVFLSVMAWGWLWGVAGAFLAVPILLVLRSTCRRTRRLKIVCSYLEGSKTEVPTLASLVAR